MDILRYRSGQVICHVLPPVASSGKKKEERIPEAVLGAVSYMKPIKVLVLSGRGKCQLRNRQGEGHGHPKIG